jgi:hypothetical protein
MCEIQGVKIDSATHAAAFLWNKRKLASWPVQRSRGVFLPKKGSLELAPETENSLDNRRFLIQ